MSALEKMRFRIEDNLLGVLRSKHIIKLLRLHDCELVKLQKCKYNHNQGFPLNGSRNYSALGWSKNNVSVYINKS